jgi:hypothetical protein
MQLNFLLYLKIYFLLKLILGESTGVLPLCWKIFFSPFFFRSTDQRGPENAFDKKSTVLSDEIGHFAGHFFGTSNGCT